MSRNVATRSLVASLTLLTLLCYLSIVRKRSISSVLPFQTHMKTSPPPSVPVIDYVQPEPAVTAIKQEPATNAESKPTPKPVLPVPESAIEPGKLPDPDPYRKEVEVYDFKETEEETQCRHSHVGTVAKPPFPKVVHFIFLSPPGKKTSMEYRQYLAIKAAKLQIKPEKIKIHTYDMDTRNQHWEKIAKHVELVHHGRDVLDGPNNHKMSTIHLAHQSDWLRIHILLKEGGIYLDTDIYALKDFDHLLNNSRDVLLGHEGGDRQGFCNAVILARPNNEFMHKWRDSYSNYDPKYWNHHSIVVPKHIHRANRDLVCPLAPHIFFWPTYRPPHVRYMHDRLNDEEKKEMRVNMTANGGTMYANQLANHGWGVSDANLKDLSEEFILREDTRFNMLVRDIVKADL